MKALVPIVVSLAAGLSITWALEIRHRFRQLMSCETNVTQFEFDWEMDQDELLYVDLDKKQIVQRLPEFAEQWCRPESLLAETQINREICKTNVEYFAREAGLPPEKKVAPQTMVYAENLTVLGQLNTLICFASGFYPMPIKMSWTKNVQPVTEGVSRSQLYSNEDFTFRTFSYLTFTPALGDVYSCRVEHRALTEPDTKIYVVDVNTESDTRETALCGAGLALGLLGVALGLFFLIKGNHCN
ncbi:H-2 class II histocompatibility antigen, A-U alpha chain [Amia ocellicauda]|uniref:H-2 class II histocompatibility antigen, A-U alpha chain n=1 Tax=Amia ocellicauda TaxID=2972642 RepID=UPI0034639326